LLFDDTDEAMMAAERKIQKDNQGVFDIFTGTSATLNCDILV
jgi:hypothetical protein